MSRTRRPDAPEQLADILAGRTATASKLLQRAERLAALTESVHALEPAWSAQVRVGNLRGDTAVLYADTAAVAARARLSAHALAGCLARHGVRVENLVIKVRPVHAG